MNPHTLKPWMMLIINLTSQVSFVLLVLVCVVTSNSNTTCNKKDLRALQMFKESVIDPSNRLSNWSSHQHCCAWPGVSCDDEKGRVNELDLESEEDSESLRGTINLSSLLQLQFLQYLYLSYNDFEYISMPSAVNDSNLMELDLSFNSHLHIDNFHWLSPLSSLENLDLSGIDLHMQTIWLQSILESLPSLSELYLKDCNLTNVHLLAPAANFSMLEILDLSFNYQLHMENLHWLSPFSSLDTLDLTAIDLHEQTNWLHSFASLPSLSSLSLKHCQLTNIHPSRKISSLVFLDLSFNYHLHMDNFSWLSTLSSLEYLDLSGIDLHKQTNWLQSLTSLPSLSYLLLKNCNLTNIYPSDKNVNLSSLSNLDLAENNFNTQLPYWLFNLSNEFMTLNLSHCNFRGQIPDWFGKFNHLLSLDLSNNLFHGSIPSNLANLSSQGTLDISFNDLSGNLPKSFERQFFFLDLSHNSLSGDLSNFLLTSQCIVMAFNKFEGGLPHLSHEVSILDLAHNSFSGSLSPLLCQIEHTSQNLLLYLDVSSNFLTGELPDCWNKWKHLSSIHLGSNNLTGEVPPSMGSLFMLQSLDLHDNGLFGHIPSSFQHSITLVLINLERNKFSGSITNCMPQNISIVKLRSNQFTGNIPSQLCSLSSLIVLDLADNKFSGSIPNCLNNLTSMVKGIPDNALTLYELSISGEAKEISYTFKLNLTIKGQKLEYSKNLRFVRSIDLSVNKLSGEIPPQLFQLFKLQSLNLSYNHLTGKVPDQIGMMTNMESLDLSHNKFHGKIPQSISGLSFLSYLNVSYNNFIGQIPLGTQLQSFNASSYVGNSELCGAPLKNCIEPQKQHQKQLDEEDEDDNFWKSLYLGMGVGFAVGFWIVSGSLFLIRAWRHRFFRWFDGVVDRIYVIVALKFRNLH